MTNGQLREYVSCINSLGLLYLHEDSYTEARELLEQVLEFATAPKIVEQVDEGVAPPLVIRSNIALTHKGEGRFTVAEPSHDRRRRIASC